WCLLFNGQHLRIVDAVRLFARRHIEFDLNTVLDDERAFTTFWTIAHAKALCGESSDAQTLRTLVELSDRHAADVCRSLKDNVLAASAAVVGALAMPATRGGSGIAALPGINAADAAFEQSLIIVYRLVFLLFAEARALVP